MSRFLRKKNQDFFRRVLRTAAALMLCSAIDGREAAAQFADSVVSVSYGAGYSAGYGPDNPNFPNCVFGKPDTSATPFVPAFAATELLSLGTGGEITLYFRRPIVNRAGADFTVFENVFYSGTDGDTTNPFVEAAFVSVSKDGINFVRFPYQVDTLSVMPPRYRYKNLAGTTPTNGAANPFQSGSPLEGKSGGDSFDLSDVGLDSVRYLRITDAGSLVPDSFGGNSFDLDAVAVIHQAALSASPAPTTVSPRPASGFSLSQNYPNPFNPETAISYRLIAGSEVSLKVFDVLGKEVATLVNERKAAGNYSVRFNAAGLSGGVYFYQLRTGEAAETRRMTLVK